MSVLRLPMRWLWLLVISIGLAACSDEHEATAVDVLQGPVAFESGEECHVCGMIITEYPGAKGQIITSRDKAVHKFCSTQDMLSWWLQPENQHLQAEIYVHDIAKTPWDQPQDEHLIDARSAWYVLGSNLQGAMGPSLATYSDRAVAESVVAAQGGRVLSWDELDMGVLQELAMAGHEHAAQHAEHLRQAHGVDEHTDEHAPAMDMPREE